MNAQKSITFSIAGLMALSWIPAVADINLGVFPRRPAAITTKAFKPLAAHLSEVMGEKVTLSVSKNFKDFWKKLKAGKYDLVHYNQYHYLLSHKEMGFTVIIANEEKGSRLIAGALSVHVDSGIKSVKDLKGKTILFGGGKKAMGSYIAPIGILKKHGLVAGKDFKVAFAKNPPSAVIGVYNKAADAAGSGNIILKVKGVKKKIDVSKMRIVEESEPFVHLSWAVKKDFPADKAKKIQDAMTALSGSDKGKAILKSAKVTGFYAVSDADFAKVREITEYAIGEKY
ncbi:MAG: phosphate/phosphite/phosphonate ABC transporter substrate-binding protein [Ectothiorhodospiraceae bacterium]|nr:phosphate/phosphite/phosphonate ABC transporter substrate-binding protein [Ectothiorhodospiraceae bacterium]